MRRPLFFIFIFVFFISFLNIKDEEDFITKTNIQIQDTIKHKKEKDDYDEYVIGNYLFRDYTKGLDFDVGIVLNTKAKVKKSDRYIKSCGYNALVDIYDYKVVDKNLFYYNIGKISSTIKENIRYLYKDDSNFINSLVLGLKSELSQDEIDMFSNTGTSHIIALSGLHISIICSFIVFFTSKINRFYKLFIVILILGIYTVMVGVSYSILRAIGFMILFYISYFIDRKNDGISNLCFLASLFILNNSYTIYNISFQLSFMATLSIIYFYRHVNKYLKNSFLSVSISANILTLPIVYYNFKSISTVSLLGNLVVVPFIGIIIYLSIFSIILFNFNIYFYKILVFINRVIIDFIYFLLDKISNLTFSYIEFENTSFIYVLVYYIGVFTYMIYKEFKTLGEQKNDLQGYYKEHKI